MALNSTLGKRNSKSFLRIFMILVLSFIPDIRSTSCIPAQFSVPYVQQICHICKNLS
ncbi:unnamed protein product [Arabidopsis lyrata]|nr:unnamed protein product [Arabidopsis lyrata]